MLRLFKVAVDNFMNIRLEAFQKRGGPRYDAEHAGTVSLISNVDGMLKHEACRPALFDVDES